MSCERGSNTIATWAGKISAGIATLAHKRAFYAALALSGAGLTALLIRRASPKARPGRRAIPDGDIPRLPVRNRLEPVALQPDQACARCGAQAGQKEGAWYLINKQSYCLDCAPEAARQADVDLSVSAGRLAGADPHPARTGVASRRPALEALTPERRLKTRLESSRVRVRLGDGPDSPAWFVVDEAQVVLRPDGLDTGLALTPALTRNGSGRLVADPSAWSVTHIGSGKGLSGPFRDPVEAHGLASIIAQLDWTRPEEDLPPSDLQRLQLTEAAYRQALRTAGMGNGASGGPTPQVALGEPVYQMLGATSLAGQLLADSYGGLARVIEDNGATLFMRDHLGQRYEVRRDEVRPPAQQDFELSRVARSFDPTRSERIRHCTGCGRSTRRAGLGEVWYQMGWQTHCESCARQYAAREAYIFDSEVGLEL